MTDAATHLFRGNEKGEILDADGKVVGRIVPVEPTEAMTERGFHAFIAAHDIAFRQNEPTAPIYKHMLSAAPTDWSQHAVRVPERERVEESTDDDLNPIETPDTYPIDQFGIGDSEIWRYGWNAALDAIIGAAK